MTHFREDWQGICLAGNYTLEDCFAGDENAAFFQASLADGRRAVVKLVRRTAGEDALLDLWYRMRQLRHPNLIELLDFGRAEHSGEIVLYEAFESPDETLAAALSRSPLNAAESREVLDAAIDALRYLHAQGLVLGALDAGNVVAAGDRVKLSTHAVREAESSAASREDVRLLGVLWQQALMPASPKSEEIAAHAADPNPQTRWTLAEIHAALNPPAPVPQARVSLPVRDEPVAESPQVARPQAVSRKTASPTRPLYGAPRTAPTFRFPRWIFVGAAAFLLLIFALNRPRHADVAAERRVAPGPATAGAPAPVPAPSAPAGVAPNSVPPPASRERREAWRVIAFTFRTRSAAEQKVEQLNRYHPGLHANVFSPGGQRGAYLVSLGGPMTYEDALRVQRAAKGKGLPRHLSVQKYL
jgi:hypothetical protein